MTPLPDLDALEKLFEQQEPRIRAFVPEQNRFARLRAEAAELAERFPEDDRRPPLFGVGLAIKDIFHAAGFTTRAGSSVPPERLAGDEAESVSRLKRAGVLVIGKAVTTEFAYFGPGPTRNPHDLDRTPGGSSSGSAAAVAAGLCDLALGTQTIGSISRPASYCGVVGFKPSYERISRAGVVPLSPSLDHIGVFARETDGARSAAAVLCEGWREVVTEGRPKLGIPEGPYLERADDEGRDHFHGVIAGLRDAGLEVVGIPVMEDVAEIKGRHELICSAEAARVHAPWYGEYRDTYHPKTRRLIDAGLEVDDVTLAAALDGRTELRDRLVATMAAHGIDLWISPAAPGPAPRGLDSTGDPVMNLPWSHAGLPTLTLPAGRLDGMPMGLQIAASWYCDEELFARGSDLERALQESVAMA